MNYRYTLWLSLLLLALSWPYAPVFAQDGQIEGTVVDESGEPLTGVNLIVDKIAVGAVTNSEGYYSISGLEPGGYTVFASFIGFATQEISGVVVAAGETVTLDIVLIETELEMGDIVVTALGVERAERSLTYGTQNVSPVGLAEARELNLAFSLAGKVAGLAVNQAGTGLGGQTRLILRGNRSINGSSRPLFVVDGVPVREDISNLNASDIENISVLKGPNAAALYGSAAQNGAVVITTKRGTAGEVTARFSTNLTVQQPLILTEFQNEYGQGSGGAYNGGSEFSWGPRMTGQTVDFWTHDPMQVRQYAFEAQPNNVADVFQTGYQSSTNIAASVGSQRVQGFFSYSFTDARGTVPGNTLTRHNTQVRVTSQPSDRLSLDGKLNYVRQVIENRLSTGESFSNPIRHAYRLPRNIRSEDASSFEYFTEGGERKQHYWVPGSNGGANPYWTLNRNLNANTNDRIILLSSATYEFMDGLTLMVRGSFDGDAGSGDSKFYADSYIIAQDGSYSLSKSNSYVWNGDFLASYRKSLPGNVVSFDINVGGNTQQRRNTSLSANTGQALTVPNFFTLSNTQNVVASQGVGSPVDIHSLYAFGKVAWKDAVYLDLTGRNDWSSTLPADEQSYFYPSVGLSAIVSELLPLPDAVSFARIRASWAKVGNSAPPFQLVRSASLSSGGNNGFLQLSGTLPNKELRPEETVSTEIGLDMRFFRNRLGLDATVYKTNTRDQLFTVALPPGSGANSFFTNGGDVENKGLELMLSATPVRTNDLNVDIDLNFAMNRNKVVAISDERPRLQVASEFLRAYFIEEGEPFGNVYSRGFQRDEQGRILVAPNGMPRVTAGRTVNVANFNPDWLGSVLASISWKNWDASILIDHRQGGTVTSLTNAILYADGVTSGTLNGRDGGLVFGQNFWSHETAVMEDGSLNTTAIDAETFWRGVGGRNAPVGEAFIVDATNTRVREMTMGYSFPRSMFGNVPISGMRIALVARNLFFIHRASENLDPDVIVGIGKAAEGFDSFAPPSSRSVGFNLSIDY